MCLSLQSILVDHFISSELGAFLSLIFRRRFVACQATRGSPRTMRSALKGNDVCGSSLDLISLRMTLLRLIVANSEDCTGRCRSSIPFAGDEFRRIMAGNVHHEPRFLHHDTQTSILGFQVFLLACLFFDTWGRCHRSSQISVRCGLTLSSHHTPATLTMRGPQ